MLAGWMLFFYLGVRLLGYGLPILGRMLSDRPLRQQSATLRRTAEGILATSHSPKGTRVFEVAEDGSLELVFESPAEFSGVMRLNGRLYGRRQDGFGQIGGDEELVTGEGRCTWAWEDWLFVIKSSGMRPYAMGGQVPANFTLHLHHIGSGSSIEVSRQPMNLLGDAVAWDDQTILVTAADSPRPPTLWVLTRRDDGGYDWHDSGIESYKLATVPGGPIYSSKGPPSVLQTLRLGEEGLEVVAEEPCPYLWGFEIGSGEGELVAIGGPRYFLLRELLRRDAEGIWTTPATHRDLFPASVRV